MKIYVKENVERIAGDEETAKKLEANGFKAINSGARVIPSLIPESPVKPSVEATETVRRRRRSQKNKPATE